MLNLTRKLLLTGVVSLTAINAYASGFKLETQTVSVLGDSGDAAVVEDAGTNWYNSAGLNDLPRQLVFSLSTLVASSQFSGTSTAPGLFGGNYSANGTANSSQTFFIPGFHYSQPVSSRIAIGMTAAPYVGLGINFGEGSLVRYNVTKVYSRGIDLSPSLALKMTDKLSIGFGPDFNYWAIQNKSKARTQIVTATDSATRYSVDDWSTGGHFGILYHLTEGTRIGLNYRSKIVMHLAGYTSVSTAGLGVYESNNLNINLPLPPITTLSIYHDVTPRWAMMGTIELDQWNVVKQLALYNVQSIGTVLPVVVQQQRLSNTVDVGVGTHYKLFDKLMVRGTLRYEPTATNSQYRGLVYPDASRLLAAIGMNYKFIKNASADLLYMHIFMRTVHINDVNVASLASSVGQVRASGDVYGAQLVWDI